MPSPRDLAYFARELGRRPPSFLARRAWSEVGRLRRQTLAALGGRPYRARGGVVLASAQSLIDHAVVDDALAFLAEENPAELDALRRRADAVLRGEWTLFSHAVELSPPVAWHLDPVSGARWPVRFHTRYSYADILDLGRPSDVKMSWELSRLQFLPVLALAFRLTGDEGYASRALALIDDWDRANPVGYGPGWMIGMEAALRAVSLILTWQMVADTRVAPGFAESRLGAMLEEHGRFLAANVEYSDVNGNHYTACLLGLLYLGIQCRGVPEAEEWARRGASGLEAAIFEQTYADGVCHEGSIPYHRLVLELFLHAASLLSRAGRALDEPEERRLEEMLDFVVAYTKPSGEAPAWGDADDARVAAVGGQPISDHRYLLTWGGARRDRPDLVARAGEPRLDGFLLLDRASFERARTLGRERRAVSPPGDAAFAESGFFVLRGPRAYCLIDCGDVGLRGRGGHGHNDVLSVELTLAGRDALTDTGAASYTRSVERRLESLSASAHNVAILDHREPAPITRARLPHASACPAEVVAWEPERGVFVGLHRGYSRPGGPTIYRRRVELAADGTQATLVDRIEGAGEHTVTWFLQIAVGWKREHVGEAEISFVDGARSARLVVRCRPEAAPHLERVMCYPTYDAPAERWRLCFERRAELPVEARFELSVSDLSR